jgi:hypothetical protein
MTSIQASRPTLLERLDTCMSRLFILACSLLVGFTLLWLLALKIFSGPQDPPRLERAPVSEPLKLEDFRPKTETETLYG